MNSNLQFKSQRKPIEVKFSDVSYSRGDRILFQGLNFTVSSGEILWIQGANGIGKTSILKLASHLARPDIGRVQWQQDNQPASPRALVSYQGHTDSFESRFSPHEEISFWQEIYGSELEVSHILDKVGLSDQSQVKIGKLSAGQKRRLSFARILMSQRPVWLLDEPKASIDKDGEDLIDKFIQNHAENDGIAIIVSHSLAHSIGKYTRRLVLEPAQ